MKLSSVVRIGMLSYGLSVSVHASVVTDPAGDFLATLTPLAPRAGDMDVISSEVSLVGSNLLFSATLNAPINTTPEAFYVWGVYRGAAMPSNFNSLGLPNIIFDAVVSIQNEGTGVVNDLTGADPPATLAAGAVTSSGNTIQALAPLSFAGTPGIAVRMESLAAMGRNPVQRRADRGLCPKHHDRAGGRRRAGALDAVCAGQRSDRHFGISLANYPSIAIPRRAKCLE